MDLIWQNGVRFHDLRILATFVWAVVGLILSRQIHLSRWGLYRVGPTKAASKERQLARWLDNPRILPSHIYRSLIWAALTGKAKRSIWPWTAVNCGCASPWSAWR